MAGIVQGVMGDAFFPDLTSFSSAPNATQEASGEYFYKRLTDDQIEKAKAEGWLPEEIQHLDSHPDDLKFYQTVYDRIAKEKSRIDITPDNYVDYMKGLASKGNKDAIDWLVNYYSTWEANKWAAERDDSAYQRLNKDLMAAGISPYVLSGATPQISSVKMPNSSSFADTEKNKRSKESSDRGNVLQMLGYGLLTAGRIIAALF